MGYTRIIGTSHKITLFSLNIALLAVSTKSFSLSPNLHASFSGALGCLFPSENPCVSFATYRTSFHQSHLFYASPKITFDKNVTEEYPYQSGDYNKKDIDTHKINSYEDNKQYQRALLALGGTLPLTYKEASSFLNSNPRLFEKTSALHTNLLLVQSVLGIRSKQRMKKMILSHPSLVAAAILDMENLMTSTELLQEELKLSDEEVWKLAIVSFPQIRNYSRSMLRQKLHFYRTQLLFSQHELKMLVLRQPKVLQHSPEVMEEAIRCLTKLFFADPFTVDEIKDMMIRFPSFLTYDTEKNLVPTAQYLLDSEIGQSLGVISKNNTCTDKLQSETEKQSLIQVRVKRMLLQCPALISLSVHEKLKPTVEFMLGNSSDIYLSKTCIAENEKTKRHDCILGCSLDDFGRILWRYPDVLKLSVENNLKPKVQYFKEYLHLNSSEEASLIFTRNPLLCRQSLQNNLMPKMNFFKNHIGFTRNELKSFIIARPQTLSLSLENNIEPKIKYLLSKEGGNLNKAQLKAFMLERTGLLHVPLKEGIMKRLSIMKDHGLNLNDTSAPIFTISNKGFQNWIKNPTLDISR